jgi:hypothetical protein
MLASTGLAILKSAPSATLSDLKCFTTFGEYEGVRYGVQGFSDGRGITAFHR